MDDRAQRTERTSPTGPGSELADRFRALAEHGSDAIVEVDSQRRVVFVSSNFSDAFGHAADAVIGRDVLDLIHPDEQARVERIHGNGRDAVFDLRFRMRHRDGDWRWVESTACPYRAQDGAIRVVLVTRDATERVNAERRAVSQVEAEKQIAELSQFFLSLRVEDFDGGIDRGLTIAARLARADRIRFYLVDTEDGKGRFFHWDADGISAHDAEASRGLIAQHAGVAKRMLRGEVVNVPDVPALPDESSRMRQRLMDQGVRSFLVIPIRYLDRTMGFVAFYCERESQRWDEHDIKRLQLLADMFASALRRNRNEISEIRSRQRLETLAANASDAICELSPAGRLLYASAGFTDLTGYTVADFREIGPFSLVHPEDRDALASSHSEKFAAQDAPGTASFRMRHRDGDWRWLEATARPFRTNAGEDRIAVVLRDVTSRHQRQVELTSQLRLERSLATLSREFLDRGADEIDAGIDFALGTTGALADADRCWLVAQDEDGGEIHRYEWCAPGIDSLADGSDFSDAERFRWTVRKLAHGEAVNIHKLTDVPGEARELRDWLAENGVQSMLALPIRSGERLIGVMGFHAVRREQRWTEHAVGIFQLIAGMFTSALRRKSAEANLRGSEARFRALAENAVDPICEVSEFGRFLYASPSLGDLLGYDVDQVGDLNFFTLIHPDDFRAMRDAYTRGTRDDLLGSRIYRVRHENGGWVYVEGTASVFRGANDETRIVNILRDVTERQRAQEALERQLDLETRIAALSRRFLSVGVDEIDDTLQQSLSELAALAEADRSLLFSFDSQIDDILDVFEWYGEDVPSQSRELFEVNPAKFPWISGQLARGQIIHVPRVENMPAEAALEREGLMDRGVRSLLGIPLHSGDSPVGLLEFETVHGSKSWSAERITLLRLVGEIFVTALQRKRTEMNLRNSQMQLMQAQKMEAVGTLAGGIAHDFNNQLTVMLGNARYVLRQVEDDPDLKDALTDLNRAADHCSQLTRSLLAFSRRGPVNRRTLDLQATVDEAQELLRPLIPSSIDFQVTHGADSASVEGDATQLQQVLVNLAVNARDAMQDGGSLIISTDQHAMTRDDAARVGLPRPGSYVEIAVLDTGCGMDDATVERIFDPFFTTKPLGEGTGLGLATAYGIVTESGGAIEVETARGAGTTFRVYLPVASGPADVDDRPAARDLPRQPGTVVVVEDEASVRRFVQRTLEQSGFATLAAENGIEALRVMAAHRGPIDAVVTDIDMPLMGGIALARKLARGHSRLPVLFVSGSARDLLDEPVAQEALGSFLQKPFSEEDLVAEVIALIGASRRRTPP